MASIRASIVAAAVVSVLAHAAGAQTTTSTTQMSTTSTTLQTSYLKCYKALDPLALSGPSPSWLQLDAPGLATEHCRILGGFRMVCIPAAARLSAGVQVRIGAGAYGPLTPITLPSEETVTQDRLCYKIRCQEPATIDQNVTFTDQFGARRLSRYKPYVVCGPAVSELCGDGKLDFGEECDDGNLKAGDCCDSKCHFEPTTQACGTDTDNNPCTQPRCDGAGTCSQAGFLPAGSTCPDTDNNVCTSARCDGAGTCDQSAILSPATTSCPDTDSNDCTVPSCDGNGACNQLASTLADGAPCADKDGNVCTLARCAAGSCDQTVLASLGKQCPDTDGNACTDAACDGNGSCQQDLFVRNCTSPQVCNTATGTCE